MQEVPVIEASNQPRLIYLGILFVAAIVSALVSWLYYVLFEPAGSAEMGPVVGLLFVLLMLPAWWGGGMLLVYLIFTINGGVSWLTKRPVLKSPPQWLKTPSIRDEVLGEARISLWLLAACVGLGLFVSALKLIVGPQ